MLTAERSERKRTYHPLWMMAEMPLCTKCNRMRIVTSSRTENGIRIQYRRCPVCGSKSKNTYPVDLVE